MGLYLKRKSDGSLIPIAVGGGGGGDYEGRDEIVVNNQNHTIGTDGTVAHKAKRLVFQKHFTEIAVGDNLRNCEIRFQESIGYIGYSSIAVDLGADGGIWLSFSSDTDNDIEYSYLDGTDHIDLLENGVWLANKIVFPDDKDYIVTAVSGFGSNDPVCVEKATIWAHTEPVDLQEVYDEKVDKASFALEGEPIDFDTPPPTINFIPGTVVKSINGMSGDIELSGSNLYTAYHSNLTIEDDLYDLHQEIQTLAERPVIVDGVTILGDGLTEGTALHTPPEEEWSDFIAFEGTSDVYIDGWWQYRTKGNRVQLFLMPRTYVRMPAQGVALFHGVLPEEIIPKFPTHDDTHIMEIVVPCSTHGILMAITEDGDLALRNDMAVEVGLVSISALMDYEIA
jgi:hypothetical protein